MEEQQTKQQLREHIGIPDGTKCICAVGSGGKTTLLYRLAQEYRAAGKKVLLMTTTKMYRPEEYGVLGTDGKKICAQLQSQGFAVAGTAFGEEKMAALPEAAWRMAYDAADIVLAECDGSKRLPLKFPSQSEPVLPKECDFLIAVQGMAGIGKPLGEVCHRAEDAGRLFGWALDHIVTEEDAACLLTAGYEAYLKTMRGCYFLNQSDCLSETQKKRVAAAMRTATAQSLPEKEIRFFTGTKDLF